jgi:hypothetical protein
VKIQHPLVWPEGWRRVHIQAGSSFDCKYKQTVAELESSIRKIGGEQIVLTHNRGQSAVRFEYLLETSSFSDLGEIDPDDCGVAVWFKRDGKQMVFACDRWCLVKDNVRAIVKTIEALRGIERWGASHIMEQAFKGFEALPSPGRAPDCWEILGVPPGASRETINAAYRARAAFRHPDAGGSHELMAELNAARDQALRSAAP